jgi:hypothetical protein
LRTRLKKLMIFSSNGQARGVIRTKDAFPVTCHIPELQKCMLGFNIRMLVCDISRVTYVTAVVRHAKRREHRALCSSMTLWSDQSLTDWIECWGNQLLLSGKKIQQAEDKCKNDAIGGKGCTHKSEMKCWKNVTERDRLVKT